MPYTTIATQEVTLESGYHVTLRLARTVAQEEAGRRDDGRLPGYVLLYDLIQSWDLDDDDGVMPLTLENVQRLTVPDAVFLLGAYNKAQEARRKDVDFTDTSPTGPEASETTRQPGSDSFLSIVSAGESSD